MGEGKGRPHGITVNLSLPGRLPISVPICLVGSENSVISYVLHLPHLPSPEMCHHANLPVGFFSSKWKETPFTRGFS